MYLLLLFLFLFPLLLLVLLRPGLRLPPGPFSLPIFGSWLQLGNAFDQHDLAALSRRFGDLILVRMGSLPISVVSSPALAKQVLLTKGKEFGSRSRNIVFDIFTGKGQDMIFTEYGDHWRKMRRITTAPFFTAKAVTHYRADWEAEAEAVVADVKKNPKAAVEGVVLRRRLELMVYNNVYKMMFDKRFESEEDEKYVRLKSVNGERSRLGQSLEYNFGDFIPMLRPFLRGYLKVCKEVTRRRLDLYKDTFLQDRK